MNKTIVKELKTVKFRDIEDLIYRLQVTYDEIVDLLVDKYIAGSTIGYTLPPGVYKISDINLMLKSLLLGKVKIKITIDDVRRKSKLKNIKTIRWTKKYFFNTTFCIRESHSGKLEKLPSFVQLIPGSYKGELPNNITGIDIIPLKCDCINGSNVNGIRETILYSIGPSSPPIDNIYNAPRIELFQKIIKPVLPHIRFFLSKMTIGKQFVLTVKR